MLGWRPHLENHWVGDRVSPLRSAPFMRFPWLKAELSISARLDKIHTSFKGASWGTVGSSSCGLLSKLQT